LKDNISTDREKSIYVGNPLKPIASRHDDTLLGEMMKTLLFLLSLSSVSTGQSLHIKGGLDISTHLNRHTAASDATKTSELEATVYTPPGVHIETLLSYPLSQQVEIGVGTRWESGPRKQNNAFTSVGYSTIPVFLLVQYTLLPFKASELKVTGRAGYSMVQLTTDRFRDRDEQTGGLYYGIGLSLEENKPDPLLWELLYSVSNASFNNAQAPEERYRNKRISVTIGKKWSF
tara:strand:- start:202 stop:897 length:696 start_codon:yes stop_codon:yes gene_type:complete